MVDWWLLKHTRYYRFGNFPPHGTTTSARIMSWNFSCEEDVPVLPVKPNNRLPHPWYSIFGVGWFKNFLRRDLLFHWALLSYSGLFGCSGGFLLFRFPFFFCLSGVPRLFVTTGSKGVSMGRWVREIPGSRSDIVGWGSSDRLVTRFLISASVGQYLIKSCFSPVTW